MVGRRVVSRRNDSETQDSKCSGVAGTFRGAGDSGGGRARFRHRKRQYAFRTKHSLSRRRRHSEWRAGRVRDAAHAPNRPDPDGAPAGIRDATMDVAQARMTAAGSSNMDAGMMTTARRAAKIVHRVVTMHARRSGMRDATAETVPVLPASRAAALRNRLT